MDGDERSTFPTDLYFLVTQHIDRPSELAVLARVDRAWCSIAREKLYRRLWVRPWEPGADAKFKSLFTTLSAQPHVASLVRSLDVRYFPLATGAFAWKETSARALGNLTGLETLTWTRKTTLTTRMLEALATLPALQRLEINGFSKGVWGYDASLLKDIKSLKDIKLLMPDRELVAALLDLLRHRAQEQGTRIEALDIISRDAKYIDDRLLIEMAPLLTGLKSFRLLGCSHVGPKGYFAVIRSCAETLEDLALEGCGWGDDADLLDDDFYLERESTLSVGVSLPRLRSLAVTELAWQRLLLPDRSRQEQRDMLAAANTPRFDMSTAIRHAYPQLGSGWSFLPPDLDSLHISRGRQSDEEGPIAPASATYMLYAIVSLWPSSLRKLWLSDLVLDWRDIQLVAETLTGLETLMFRSPPVGRDKTRLTRPLVALQQLRVLHLQAHNRRPGVDELSMEDLEAMAGGLAESLEQIGWANRVYQVCRARQDDGDHERVLLEPWNRPGVIPEVFQVWRA